MADNEKPKPTSSVGDRFPNLKQLEEDVERANLDQALAEARAATASAKQPKPPDMPNLDLKVAPDTVTKIDYVTGLARVFVQMDAMALADDIAEATLNAARKAGHARRYKFRVVHDASLLAAVDRYRMLDGQLKQLNTRLKEVAPEEQEKEEEEPEDPVGAELASAAVVAAISVAAQAIGAVSKLFAHDYQLSGREVSPENLGFDLDLAHYLVSKKKPDETVTVEVDRLMPTPPAAQIVTDAWELADATEKRLIPRVRALAHAHAESKSKAETTKAAIAALDEQIKELTKLIPAKHEETSDVRDALAAARQNRDALHKDLPDLEATLAENQHDYERGVGLLRDIEAFLTSILAPGATGGRPALLDASRAELLAAPAAADKELQLVVYVQLIAAGVDQTVDLKRLRDDDLRVLAGATAEFAVFSSGALLDSGVRSVLQSSKMKLNEDDSFEQHRLNYLGLQRE